MGEGGLARIALCGEVWMGRADDRILEFRASLAAHSWGRSRTCATSKSLLSSSSSSSSTSSSSSSTSSSSSSTSSSSSSTSSSSLSPPPPPPPPPSSSSSSSSSSRTGSSSSSLMEMLRLPSLSKRDAPEDPSDLIPSSGSASFSKQENPVPTHKVSGLRRFMSSAVGALAARACGAQGFHFLYISKMNMKRRSTIAAPQYSQALLCCALREATNLHFRAYWTKRGGFCSFLVGTPRHRAFSTPCRSGRRHHPSLSPMWLASSAALTL
eukprot:scaffold926_cov248-Pinguiococcus_pyrenoidosus.AAC.27